MFPRLRRSVLPLAILLMAGGNLALARQFTLGPAYSTGNSPASVASVDLNGDGKLDLAVSNAADNTVGILLGNGDGTFQHAINYAVSASPEGIAAGDFNGDGKPDLVVADSANSTISVLLGNGDGTFRPATNYAAGTSPSGLAVADFNSDGKLDVAVTNSTGTVSILAGNGLGGFQAPVAFTVGSSPRSVASADFNGDGHPDLVVSNYASNTVSVLLGTGTGSFKPAVSYAAGTGPLGVAAADLYGNGKIDIVVADNASIWVVVLPGNGDGTFGASTMYEAGTAPTAVGVGDFNGDGREDLVLSNDGSNTLSVLLGSTGTSAFTGLLNYDAQSGAVAVAVGDYNRDGTLDAVVVNSVSNTVTVFLGNGRGQVAAPISYGIGGSPQYVAVGQFTAGGPYDLVGANGGVPGVDSSLTVLQGLGNGTFHLPALNYPVQMLPTSIAVGDYNGDGVLDLANTNELSNTVSILLGSGTGTFGTASNFAAGLEPISVATADLNGDGILDLAVADLTGNAVSVLLGIGNGMFEPGVPYAVGTAPASVAIGDFNKDGKLDLVVANGGVPKSNSTISVLLGRGDGTFQETVNYTVGMSPAFVSAKDLDGDGILDLVVANSGSNTISILPGNGNGTFGAAVNYPTGSFPVTVAVADLNHDGILDLAVGNKNSNSVGLYLGVGDGTFVPSTTYTLGSRITSLAAADFTGSGYIDLVVCSGDAGLTILMNNANSPVDLSPTSLSFGDQLVGTSGSAQKVTLTNSGSTALTISNTTIGPDYVQTNNCGITVAAGASCTYSITFAPTTTGTLNEALAIWVTGAASPESVSLSGTGTAPAASLTPTSLTFATEVLRTSSAAQNVTLTTSGTAALAITSITFAGSAAGDFSQTNTCGSSVAAGASCTIGVTFKPLAKGTLTASLSLSDNAAGSPQTVSITGTGTIAQLSPASLKFASQTVGTTSPPQTVTLTNVSNTSSFKINGMLIAGTNSADFSDTATCGSSLAAGASCTIKLTFKPQAKGSRTATLSVSDDAGGLTQSVALSGTGK